MTKDEILKECRKEFELHNSEDWMRCGDCSFCNVDCWKCCSVVMKARHFNGEFDKDVNERRNVRFVDENEFVSDEADEDDSDKSEYERIADGTYIDHSVDDAYAYADGEDICCSSVRGSLSMSSNCSSGYDDYEGYNGFCGENDW